MLKSEIQNHQHEISKSSMKVDDGLSADFIKIMSNVDKSEVSPFMKFSVWETTKILKCFLQNINLSPSNDNSILFSFTNKICCCIKWNTFWWKTGTDFVVLPSQRRLLDDKNYIHSKQGFKPWNKKWVEK